MSFHSDQLAEPAFFKILPLPSGRLKIPGALPYENRFSGTLLCLQESACLIQINHKRLCADDMLSRLQSHFDMCRMKLIRRIYPDDIDGFVIQHVLVFRGIAVQTEFLTAFFTQFFIQITDVPQFPELAVLYGGYDTPAFPQTENSHRKFFHRLPLLFSALPSPAISGSSPAAGGPPLPPRPALPVRSLSALCRSGLQGFL